MLLARVHRRCIDSTSERVANSDDIFANPVKLTADETADLAGMNSHKRADFRVGQ
jgi:hypothetical protein